MSKGTKQQELEREAQRSFSKEQRAGEFSAGLSMKKSGATFQMPRRLAASARNDCQETQPPRRMPRRSRRRASLLRGRSGSRGYSLHKTAAKRGEVARQAPSALAPSSALTG